MNDILELLQLPFMQRAIYGGLLVAVLNGMLGVFLTLKKESFLADAVAHASLAGVAIGFVLGGFPLLFALIVGVGMAFVVTYLKHNSKISSDALIGILFTVLFAVGLVIMNLQESFRGELNSFLFGSILSITWQDLLVEIGAFLVITFFMLTKYRDFLYTTFDPIAAKVRGVNVVESEYLINIITTVSIVISIKIVGIVLVSAMIITPATTARLVAKRFSQMIPYSVVFSIISVIAGLFTSYFLDAPAGAAIVIVLGIMFGIVFMYKGATK